MKRISKSTEVSPLPKIWIGYILSLIHYIVLFIGIVYYESRELNISQCLFTNPFYITAFIGLTYFLVCVYRLHLILQQLTTNKYPITPVAAVALHFLPIYNLYWWYKWPREMFDYISNQKVVNMGSDKKLIALLTIIIFTSMAFFYSMILYFVLIHYLSKKIGLYIEAKRGIYRGNE